MAISRASVVLDLFILFLTFLCVKKSGLSNSLKSDTIKTQLGDILFQQFIFANR
ncbi:Uncharacterised protein [Chryseobacterium nakagawai]|nr:Uncharacterised protein [Chryseobacterium nakagawai]